MIEVPDEGAEPGTIVHADRGAQYTSWVFGHRLRAAGRFPGGPPGSLLASLGRPSYYGVRPEGSARVICRLRASPKSHTAGVAAMPATSANACPDPVPTGMRRKRSPSGMAT